MENKPLQDALDIARAARDGSTEQHVKDALDDTISSLEAKIEEQV